jgi:beta-galactosidase
MILRDRNHPSVILWGVRGNEASPREEDDRALYARTYELVRQLDPTRRPACARLSDAWHGKFVPEEVMTVNDYSNWEDPNSWPQRVTTKPWLITEYGHPKQFPAWYAEDGLLQFALNWMRYLDGIYQHPEIAGGVGWAAFDYNSPEFNTPVAVTAHHCVDDIFRLPKGFASYALASQADPGVYGPLVKVLSYWQKNTGQVYVASNAPEVELLLNGRSLGRRQPTEFPHIPHPLFLFQVNPFEPGELVARAWMDGRVVAADAVRSPAPARKLVLRADDGELIADGADMTRVVAAAVDEHGTPVPTEDRRITIEVTNGRFLGENPIHLEGGRIAFYIQTREGYTRPIAIRASADGLQPSDDLEIKVKMPSKSLIPLSDFDADGISSLK